jgi:nitrite reductase/ring-hydroxylating ferredoxin subunit
MDNECPHSGAPLGKGIVEVGRLVCPLHGWAFDVNTGEALHDASAKVSVYESVVRDGMLLVRPPG